MYHRKGPPCIRSGFSFSVCVQECPLSLMTDFLLRTARVILESLHGVEGGPSHGKMHSYTKQSLNHWASSSSVFLIQYIKPAPVGHLSCPENIWNPYKVQSSSVLQKLPQKTYQINKTNKAMGKELPSLISKKQVQISRLEDFFCVDKGKGSSASVLFQ